MWKLALSHTLSRLNPPVVCFPFLCLLQSANQCLQALLLDVANRQRDTYGQSCEGEKAVEVLPELLLGNMIRKRLWALHTREHFFVSELSFFRKMLILISIFLLIRLINSKMYFPLTSGDHIDTYCDKECFRCESKHFFFLLRVYNVFPISSQVQTYRQ